MGERLICPECKALVDWAPADPDPEPVEMPDMPDLDMGVLVCSGCGETWENMQAYIDKTIYRDMPEEDPRKLPLDSACSLGDMMSMIDTNRTLDAKDKQAEHFMDRELEKIRKRARRRGNG